MQGVLIAFEGLDQSGKQTQVLELKSRLQRAGRTVRTLSFPDYATPIGQELGKALYGERDYGADVMQLLYIANRYEYRPDIEAALREGVVLLCDRYTASSIAYGEAQGLDADWLQETQRLLPPPSLTLLLDIAPDVAVRRKSVNRDRYERDLELLTRVRRSYLHQASQPGWVRLDGEQSRSDVAARVATVVAARLALR